MTEVLWPIARVLFVMALMHGCGGEAQNPGPSTQRPLPTPALKMVAPTQVRAGDELTIFGGGFADRAIGQTRLLLEGTYVTTAGKSESVHVEIDGAQYVNQGMLRWTMGPNIPFSKDGETGTFRGVLLAKNVGLDGAEKSAEAPVNVELNVLPSILIRQMRPVNAGCAPGITATVDESKFIFEVQAVGLRPGSEVAPLRFIYTFMKENFLFTGFFSDQLGVDPETLFPKSGPITMVDDVHTGAVSRLGNGTPTDVSVFKGSFGPGAALTAKAEQMFGLTHLSTAAVNSKSSNYSADYYDATMNIVAVDSTGQQAKRTIKLRVFTPVEVSYQGTSRMARTFDPQAVSGCIPGGDIGRDVSYSELSSETRQRSFKVLPKFTGGVDINPNFFGLQVFTLKLNAEFGMEVDAMVSSSQAKDLRITAMILPKQFATFYRQTVQMERLAKLMGHGACGETQDLGSVVVTDWVWSPDLGKSKSCPPLPPSNLPKGEIFTEAPQ